jgi:hydroxymethylpyrimidine/phosphomethylpyrimidine kinase
MSPARVLIIAGSDSGGGAGVQADIKTVTALGGYAATAITAITAQNTLGVRAVHPAPPEMVAAQIAAVLEDIGADAVKTGMLLSAEIIEAVADALAPYPGIPLVLDPVMVAKGGAALLREDAVAAMQQKLFPRATLLTPNIPEAQALAGCELRVASCESMEALAMKLLELGPQAVLLKGGHAEGKVVTDILATRNAQPATFSSPRIQTRHTHGTGCTLASAIATGIAQGLALPEAVEKARTYVQHAIRTAPGLGQGHGPLNHNV